jgi:hypothetical protein
MLRAIIALGLSLVLAGCWTSDRRLFDTGDWAKLDLSGEYEVASITSSDGPRRAIFTTRPDGLVVIAPVGGVDDDEDPTVLGLVPIEGGSGTGFIAVDRATAGDSDLYYLASLDDGDLGFYFPACEATPAIEGMVVTGESTCTFSSRQALMKAALEAERFLSTRHIVAITPFLRFSRVEEAEGDAPQS